MTEINIPFIKGNQEIAKKIMEEFHRPKEMYIYIVVPKPMSAAFLDERFRFLIYLLVGFLTILRVLPSNTTWTFQFLLSLRVFGQHPLPL